jgi:hypothetical protein
MAIFATKLIILFAVYQAAARL